MASTSVQIGQVLADEVKVVMYSEGISRQATEKMEFEYTDNPQTTVNEALERHGLDSKILFLRNGCEALPVLSS